METFKKVLGKNYQYKVLLNGLIRCKWYVSRIVIKADFDENGNLMCDEITMYHFSARKSEMLYIV